MPNTLHVRNGLQVWTDRSHPTNAWVELGKGMTQHYLDLDAIGIATLQLIPQPWGVIATAVAHNNRQHIKSKRGLNGVWVKISSITPFQEARPRTTGNMQKAPQPW